MFILLAEWLHCYLHFFVVHCCCCCRVPFERCLEVWNVSGDTSCCTMTIHFTLLCCDMLYCTCFVCLMTFQIFKYFNKEVHVSSSSTWNHGKSFLFFFFFFVVSKLASRIVLFYWYW